MAQFLSIRYPLTIFLIISDGLDIQAGALLTMLRETRLGLEGQHSVLEHSIRQTQRHSEPKIKNSIKKFSATVQNVADSAPRNVQTPLQQS